MQVFSLQGDTLDAICYRHLGRTTVVEQVLVDNPGLAALGAVLPMGTLITLPDRIAEPAQPQFIQLWD